MEIVNSLFYHFLPRLGRFRFDFATNGPDAARDSLFHAQGSPAENTQPS